MYNFSIEDFIESEEADYGEDIKEAALKLQEVAPTLLMCLSAQKEEFEIREKAASEVITEKLG